MPGRLAPEYALYRIAAGHITRLAGTDDLRQITAATVRDYKTARLGAEGREVKTVAGEIQAANSLCNWAVRNGMLTSNPFANMAPKSMKRAVGEEKAYTDAEAAHLLQAARKEAGWRRWLPWLLCFNSARIGEIAELRRRDVRQEAGVWILDIVPTEARAGKNPTFQRMAPLHPAVLAEGFLDYIAGLKADGPLFPDLLPNKHGSRAATAETNFRRWVRGRAGLKDSRKPPSHGFRHRMEDALRRARVPEEVMDALTGRNNPRNAGAGYGRGFRRMPDETLKELSKVPALLPAALRDEPQAAA